MLTVDVSALSRQQLGRVGEYLARIEFARRGYTVYTPDVDDSGVDLLLHREDAGYIRVQVKSVRGGGYVFMRKRYFEPASDLALCLIVFKHNNAVLYFIPSQAWTESKAPFVSRDYEGLKSEPEYGLSVSERSLPHLQAYAFSDGVSATGLS